MMKTSQVYKAKFLDCAPKLKELRRQFARNMWTAHDRDELLIWGDPHPYNAFLAGFGTYYSTGGLGPNYGQMLSNPALQDECMNKVEAEGFSPNLCGMFRTVLGQILAGVYVTSIQTGQTARPDLYFDVHVCQGQTLCVSRFRTYFPDLPYFGLELPFSFEHVDYLVMQMHEVSEEIEKALGRRYDDELALEALKNEWSAHVLMSRIIELQKTVPAPLSARWLGSLSSVGVIHSTYHRREVVDMFRIFYEETKDRVERGIAALPVQECRLVHDGVPTWYPSPVMRYPNPFGGLFIMSGQLAVGSGAWEVDDDYSLRVAPELDELQLPLKTRDDIFRAMATLWLKYMQQVRTLQHYPTKLSQMLKTIEDWHVDGVVINRAPECRGLAGLADERAVALKERGIPVMVYEGAPNTPRDFNVEIFSAQMDAFLEGFGLKRSPDFVPVEPPEYNDF